MAELLRRLGQKHYFKTDLRRLFGGYEFYVSVIGAAAALFFSLEGSGIINNSVVTTYSYATEMSGMMIVYIFCAFAFVPTVEEDLENRYVRYQIIRGSRARYVISKITVIYLSSIFVMIAGTLLFLLLNRLRAPWVDLGIDDLSTYKAGQYAFLLQKEWYLLYCLIYALQLGMLAGVFSVLSALVSLFISNKVTTLVTPLLAYQILIEYNGTGKFNVFSFRAYNYMFTSDLCYFGFVLFLSLVPVTLLGFGICNKLASRL